MTLSNIHKTRATKKTSLITLCFATLIVGISSGFVGMLLAMLLHFIQHIAFGYSLHQVISPESFLEGVNQSPPWRRVLVLIVCGVVAGVGWWAIYRFGKKPISIPEALASNKEMPPGSTLANSLLQIITVALGSPLGREVAPREVGAIFAVWIAQRFKLQAEETKILLSCGAGAGLAAVYNVPLGGALFVMEVLLQTFSWPVLLPALATSVIAVLISWIGLGNEPLYHIVTLSINPSLIIWSVVAGPFLGIMAYFFIRVALRARASVIFDDKMLLRSLINFTLIGILSIFLPALLGNGKSPIELEFANNASIQLSFILLIFRMLICWSSLRVGAQGGLLTPSLANGALLAVILGGYWNILFAGNPLSSYAIIGAAAFLASAQKMPITAVILICELTRANLIFLVPILLAVVGSVSTSYLCQKYFSSKK